MEELFEMNKFQKNVLHNVVYKITNRMQMKIN
jgi:hypothetical protein